MITQEQWVWYGNALHFICGNECQFHLATKVGKYLVSTVGELVFHTNVPGASRKDGYQDVGMGRKYETMVFQIEGTHTECLCPDIVGHEIDFEGYNDHEAANKGHMEMCLKWADRT